MRANDFGPRSPGELVKNLSGNLVFIPATLPPTLIWTDTLVSTLTSAVQAMGELAGLGRKLPNPHRLVRMFLRREAEMSSRIEDTFARVQTMVLFNRIPGVELESPSVREVDNNFKTLEFAISAAAHRPLTRSLIKEMHAILLQGVRGQDKTPGRFRTVQAHIGRTANIDEARFVPCPPHAIESCMEGLEQFLVNPGAGNLPVVIRAAMAHYQFECIHPFADGNGRVGRVLLLLQLVKEGALPAPLLNPSVQLERNRDLYYHHLLDVSHNGNWAGWFEFFSRSLAAEATDAARRIERLESLRDRYRDQAEAAGRMTALLLRVIDQLFIEPSITAPDLATEQNVAASTARQATAKLVELGILREVTGQMRHRVYLAQEIVDLFSDSPN